MQPAKQTEIKSEKQQKMQPAMQSAMQPQNILAQPSKLLRGRNIHQHQNKNGFVGHSVELWLGKQPVNFIYKEGIPYFQGGSISQIFVQEKGKPLRKLPTDYMNPNNQSAGWTYRQKLSEQYNVDPEDLAFQNPQEGSAKGWYGWVFHELMFEHYVNWLKKAISCHLDSFPIQPFIPQVVPQIKIDPQPKFASSLPSITPLQPITKVITPISEEAKEPKEIPIVWSPPAELLNNSSRMTPVDSVEEAIKRMEKKLDAVLDIVLQFGQLVMAESETRVELLADITAALSSKDKF